MDARDLALQGLALDLAEAEASIVAYRELLQLALEQLAMATRAVERQRQTIARLCDERRTRGAGEVAA